MNNELNCANYEFCGGQRVPDMSSDFCMTCGSWFKAGFGWDKLEIIDCNEECVVCMNVCQRKLRFPTKCDHSFCLICSRNIIFWDETRYHLSPEPYGCPSCPNNCKNPKQGKQCYCEEYDSVQEIWQESNPTEFNKWNKDKNASIENSVNGITYGKGTCPLCRKKYVR